MKKHLLAMVAAGALCIGGGTAWAHHPFAAEYDANKPAQLEGRVVAVEWTNPHAFLTVEGRADNGARDRWRVELGSPKALDQHGWHRNMVRTGDEVTIKGWWPTSDQRRICPDAERARTRCRLVLSPGRRELTFLTRLRKRPECDRYGKQRSFRPPFFSRYTS